MPNFRTLDRPDLPHEGHHAAPYLAPEPELDAVWRIADFIDGDDRGPLEAEVMLWRICSAKSIPDATIRRAISEEWKSGK